MKKVFSDNSTIAHLWANQTQAEATNPQRNFYFDGDTIYSYGRHFPIAKHITNGDNSAVLFTERGYSNTTAKHVNVAWQAASHKNIILCYSPDSEHNENFAHWSTDAKNEASKLLNARKPEKYLSNIANIKGKVQKYADFFGLSVPVPLAELLSIGNKTEFLQYAENARKYEEAENARKLKEAKKKYLKDVKLFKAFKINTIYMSYKFNDVLRYNAEAQRVETSQGVQIPKALAVKFYEWLKATIQAGGCTECNYQLLSYSVTSVTAKHFVIGCHTIAMTEAESIIKLLA